MKRTILSFAFILLALLVGSVSARELEVKPGETLARIALRELGSADRWQEIAEFNNISDPRRLRVGMKIQIPEAGPVGGPSAVLPLVSGAGVRPLQGAVRLRSSAMGQWEPLTQSQGISSGFWLMTANTGLAELAVGGASADVKPFTILEMISVNPDEESLIAKLHLGAIDIFAGAGVVSLRVRTVSVTLLDADAGVSVDEAGTIRVLGHRGFASVLLPDGREMKAGAGQVVEVSPEGGARLGRFTNPFTQMKPSGGDALSAEDLLFEWNAIPGATGYRFTLRASGKGGAGIDEIIDKNMILVEGMPEGSFTWRVTPLGVANAFPSPKVPVTVDRVSPTIEVSASPLDDAGGWKVFGRAAPGAIVTVGGSRVMVNDEGEFVYESPAVEGVAVLGVEARLKQGGVPARTAVALTGKPGGRMISTAALVPAGNVTIADQPAPARLSLAEGRNNINWSWKDAGKVIAEGTAEVLFDRTPPEVVSVTSADAKITSGANIVLKVAAVDRGVGMAGPTSARMMLVGPGKFKANITASDITPEGEYIFRVKTPRDLGDGVIRVTRLEVMDTEGNATVISSEGMSTEVVDPSGKVKRFIKNLILIGIGVLAASI